MIVECNSKLVQAIRKQDVNGNGFWAVSDGEQKCNLKHSNNSEGGQKALKEFLAKAYGYGVDNYTVYQANIQSKTQFLGYAFILQANN